MSLLTLMLIVLALTIAISLMVGIIQDLRTLWSAEHKRHNRPPGKTIYR